MEIRANEQQLTDDHTAAKEPVKRPVVFAKSETTKQYDYWAISIKEISDRSELQGGNL
jgi:hypothetical protein